MSRTRVISLSIHGEDEGNSGSCPDTSAAFGCVSEFPSFSLHSFVNAWRHSNWHEENNRVPTFVVATLLIGVIALWPMGGQARRRASRPSELARAREGHISESLGLRGGVAGTPDTHMHESV